MNKTETEIKVNDQALSVDEIMDRISSGIRIDEITLGRKEVRPKVQYQNNEYFISLKLDFSYLWDMYFQLLESGTASTEELDKIRTAIKTEMHTEIMKKETYLSSVILHFEMKDQVKIWPRDPSNPAIKANTAGEAFSAVNGGASG